jgi:pilus assembly protein CpaF
MTSLRSSLPGGAASPTSGKELDKMRNYLVSGISRELAGAPPQSDEALEETLKQLFQKGLAQIKVPLTHSVQMHLYQQVKDEVLGLGPMQILLNDPDVNEVMVNGPKSVYVEKKGKLVKTNVTFRDNDHVVTIIDRIISPLGRHINAENPTVDARLMDGSRVNAVIPPVAIDGASITIRKFSKEKLGIDDLIGFGSVSPQMAEFMQACVGARLNIVISGGTGSGKTTLLNITSSFIPHDERIVTIEDAAELQLQQDHVVRLETKPPNVEGKGHVSIRDLVKNSLRMRPDRVVIGEVRGGEALDMLQAMNTGHDGSLTTLHANTPRDALSRLETMSLMSGIDMPLKVIREQIASAVDLIIQQSRLRDGSRKVTQITEVLGMEGETIVMTDLFKFEQTSISEQGKVIGEHRPTGMRPMFGSRLEAAGFKLGADIFSTGLAAQPRVSRGSRRRR